MKHRLSIQLYIFLTLAVMAFIFIQSAFPASMSNIESNSIVAMLMQYFDVSRSTLTFYVRKGAHFAEYLVMGSCLALLFYSIKKTGRYRKRWLISIFLLSCMIGIVYAVSDEIHQRFVAGRSCEFRDILIDSCGVALGVMIVSLYKWCQSLARSRKNYSVTVTAGRSRV